LDDKNIGLLIRKSPQTKHCATVWGLYFVCPICFCTFAPAKIKEKKKIVATSIHANTFSTHQKKTEEPIRVIAKKIVLYRKYYHVRNI